MRRAVWSRGGSGWAFVIAIALACGGGEPAGPETGSSASTTITLQLSLAGDLEPFKVDGRLQVFFVLASPFIGEAPVGIVVLPAGERTAAGMVVVRDQAGTLRLEEITFSPVVPFLCGTSALVDPRTQPTVTVVLELCQPCLINPEEIPDACENSVSRLPAPPAPSSSSSSD